MYSKIVSIQISVIIWKHFKESKERLMRLNKKLGFLLGVIVIIIVLITVLLLPNKTTFQEAVTDKIAGNITSIELKIRSIKDDFSKDVTITDPNEIQEIISELNKTSLKETGDLSKKVNSVENYDIFHLNIVVDGQIELFNINIYGDMAIEIYDGTKTKNKRQEYIIIDQIDLSKLLDIKGE